MTDSIKVKIMSGSGWAEHSQLAETAPFWGMII